MCSCAWHLLDGCEFANGKAYCPVGRGFWLSKHHSHLSSCHADPLQGLDRLDTALSSEGQAEGLDAADEVQQE